MRATTSTMTRLLLLLLLFRHLFVVSLAQNMNGKPGQYKIANGAKNGNNDAYSTDYQAEYFEVYSRMIRTRYSEVYWKEQDVVPLPPEIVKRFSNGNIMAVVGYEVDQVRLDPDSGEEVSVPITWAYNHHYGAFLMNSRKVFVTRQTKMQATRSEPAKDFGSHGERFVTHHLEDDDNDDDEIPKVQYFSEGNGGEFRLSYHGYPRGYAQLIESPDVFQVVPMQIDIWNRKHMKGPAFAPGPLPQSSPIPPTAGYNGLLECPCSDRLPKEWRMTYALQQDSTSHDVCTEDIPNATDCWAAARSVVDAPTYIHHEIIKNHSSYPPGCSVEHHADGEAEVYWNVHTDSPGDNNNNNNSHDRDTRTDRDESLGWIAYRHGLINVTVALSRSSSTAAGQDINLATITLVGPENQWFGIGFGSQTMCVHMEADECAGGGPYAIVVSGDQVTERKLGFHGPGSVISPSVVVQSNSVEHGNRTVVLTREWQGATSAHYTFDPTSISSVPIITARGCGLEFAPHCGHGPAELLFLEIDTPSRLCQAGISGTIGGNYFDGRNRCSPFPTSDLEVQQNPTCSVETYRGGLMCCRHGESLLDVAQDIPWPDQYLEYQLKFRFYFEEYRHASKGLPASHQNLVRFYWQTESFAGEYDIVPCRKGESQCVQAITSRWKVRDMVRDCSLNEDGANCCGRGSSDSKQTKGIQLIYAAPHCHAPTCLSMELYNADTGRLLCHVEPIHGQSDELYDEFRFLAIPPCLWGDASEAGLVQAELLSLDTNLLSIKRNNNTLPHTGEMASWQMRGIVVPASQSESPGSTVFGPAVKSTTSATTSLEETRKLRQQK